MRTTLLERLKPEFAKGLEENREEFSHTIQTLEDTLREHLFYSNLSISNIKNIWTFSDVGGSEGIFKRTIGDFLFGEDMFETFNSCT